MFATIIHPTDLSDACTAAHKAAHQLAKSLGSKLVVCYIAQPPLVAAGHEVTNPETGEIRNIVKEVESVQPPDPAVKCEVKIVMADRSANAKTVLGILEKVGCDLIVLGVHKRKGVGGWMGATITEEVVRHAKAPVMVVKPEKKAPKKDKPKKVK